MIAQILSILLEQQDLQGINVTKKTWSWETLPIVLFFFLHSEMESQISTYACDIIEYPKMSETFCL